ncbi:hypothetical protein EJ05DRAFT_55843 [Pseudovirgaria hyperparasitica]|uniref:Uncharacterized protein n=1 Tax=Pseudovirgaria hyperparasitica TaxID=470096 RepID=A0A6A6W575_9PEZI|nr:uncharacterized protein EJ05DRAFT_55843 [Pseudovirgaria hyperparasitica]KAF2757106.1 hypothetical protein EJ05DRAFT_55843 [Pseudovirgaria hyperparasitica]
MDRQLPFRQFPNQAVPLTGLSSRYSRSGAPVRSFPPPFPRVAVDAVDLRQTRWHMATQQASLLRATGLVHAMQVEQVAQRLFVLLQASGAHFDSIPQVQAISHAEARTIWAQHPPQNQRVEPSDTSSDQPVSQPEEATDTPDTPTAPRLSFSTLTINENRPVTPTTAEFAPFVPGPLPIPEATTPESEETDEESDNILELRHWMEWETSIRVYTAPDPIHTYTELRAALLEHCNMTHVTYTTVPLIVPPIRALSGAGTFLFADGVFTNGAGLFAFFSQDSNMVWCHWAHQPLRFPSMRSMVEGMEDQGKISRVEEWATGCLDYTKVWSIALKAFDVARMGEEGGADGAWPHTLWYGEGEGWNMLPPGGYFRVIDPIVYPGFTLNSEGHDFLKGTSVPTVK